MVKPGRVFQRAVKRYSMGRIDAVRREMNQRNGTQGKDEEKVF
jgi:hypothetical protein